MLPLHGLQPLLQDRKPARVVGAMHELLWRVIVQRHPHVSVITDWEAVPLYCPDGLAISTNIGIISGDSSRDQITQAAEGGMVRMYCMYINFDISASD